MPGMASPCSAPHAWRLAPGGIGFDRQFGRRSGGAEEALLSGALLVAQTIFEPGIFFFETINLLLLFQAVRAITEAMEARGLRFGFGGPFLAKAVEEHRTCLSEQSFELAAIFQPLLKERHQLGRDVHAAAAALFGEGKDKRWMLVAAGASWTVPTDAGLADFGQRTFEGRPQGEELPLEMCANFSVEGIVIDGHVVGITKRIHTWQQKNLAPKTEGLRTPPTFSF